MPLSPRDDDASVREFGPTDSPDLAFDRNQILWGYRNFKKTGARPCPKPRSDFTLS